MAEDVECNAINNYYITMGFPPGSPTIDTVVGSIATTGDF